MVFGASGAAVTLRPSLWKIVLTALALDHIALVTSGLIPRSPLLGPNISRLPSREAAAGRIALTFDDGPDPKVTPRVLEILAERHVKATFFCIGSRAAAHPELTRAMVQAGHVLENHSWSHSHAFWFLGPTRLAREIDSTQLVLKDLGGHLPRYFRAPAGIRSPLLEPLLARRGMTLVSWTRRGYDTVIRDPQRVLGRLVRGLAPGDILLLHDGSVSQDNGGRPVVLEVLPRLLDELQARGFKAAPLPRAFTLPDSR
ncbi:MAG: polysaccharide deacetylase family protein [Thermoanaerobaculales bacterium]